MNYDETWGVSFKRISEFFSTQDDVEKMDDRSFRYKDSSIRLEKLPDRINFSMRTLQTQVKITGDADADDIHHRFFMRFLSAGG